MNGKMKETLMKMAEEAYLNAYAPYSNFRVEAAILTKSGEMFKGCNVENIAFGFTSCDERNAIFTDISQRGKIEIKAIAVATESKEGASPCGACRQVISEFGPSAIVIYKYNGKIFEQDTASLLPAAFE